MEDAHFMNRCLELATFGRGRVGNAPLVGAVLVRGAEIIAKAYYSEFGKSHAERSLLEKFDQKIESEDVLYVNLEPCCHHGKTPPCTDIIIERGIKNVVYGMIDPDPRVAGKGIAALRKAGVTVAASKLTALCEYLNRGFISARTKGRPWITLKKAQMPDGTVAGLDGLRLMITSKDQDEWSHTHLRARNDAILVGVGTVTNDNPNLTLRLLQSKKVITKSDQNVQPYRIILDPHVRIQEDAIVLTDIFREQTIIVYCSASGNVDALKVTRLQQAGIRVVDVDMREGSFDWDHLWRVLMEPEGSYHGLTSILVEGGPRTWDLFKRNGFVDEEVVLVGNHQ